MRRECPLPKWTGKSNQLLHCTAHGDLKLETHIAALRFEKEDIGLQLALLRSIPEIGRVRSATILYEIENIERFPSVQDFISYCRLIKPVKSSTGKVVGSGGKKIGNHNLRCAFSEAEMTRKVRTTHEQISRTLRVYRA